MKRTMLRKDPTFNETDYGFRAFGELSNLPDRTVVELTEGIAKGDPSSRSLPTGGVKDASASLQVTRRRPRVTWADPPHRSGLEAPMRKAQPDLQERSTGSRGLPPLVKAYVEQRRASATLEWTTMLRNYIVTATSETRPVKSGVHRAGRTGRLTATNGCPRRTSARSCQTRTPAAAEAPAAERRASVAALPARRRREEQRRVVMMLADADAPARNV